MAFADEADAMKSLQKARELQEKKDYEGAAKAYREVELYSDDPMAKANALLDAARNYRRAGFYGKELDCLTILLDAHVTRIDFSRVVKRVYEIGDEFYDGHKDVVVKWLPFIHDANRMEEAYQLAVKHAPGAPEAPSAQLRLAVIRMDDDDYQKAVELLKELQKMHPDTPESRQAYIQLAYVYCRLSEIGDGDGAWAKLATEQLDEFIEKYPNDPEIQWAKKQRSLVDSHNVKRLYGLAEYYHREGKDEDAKVYLTRIVREYGTLEDAIPAEKLLAQIDSSYIPPEKNAVRKEKARIKIERNTIPLERTRVLVVPENSNGKYLLPVRDLEMNEKRDMRDALPERIVKDEDI